MFLPKCFTQDLIVLAMVLPCFFFFFLVFYQMKILWYFNKQLNMNRTKISDIRISVSRKKIPTTSYYGHKMVIYIL